MITNNMVVNAPKADKFHFPLFSRSARFTNTEIKVNRRIPPAYVIIKEDSDIFHCLRAVEFMNEYKKNKSKQKNNLRMMMI